jgi:DNA-binding IclR family transcriptional regulator
VLEALGNHDRLRVVLALLAHPMTEKEVRLGLAMEQTAATRALTHLRLVGLVTRDRPRGPYSLTLPRPTRALLRHAAELADQIRTRQDESERELRGQLDIEER